MDVAALDDWARALMSMCHGHEESHDEVEAIHQMFLDELNDEADSIIDEFLGMLEPGSIMEQMQEIKSGVAAQKRVRFDDTPVYLDAEEYAALSYERELMEASKLVVVAGEGLDAARASTEEGKNFPEASGKSDSQAEILVRASDEKVGEDVVMAENLVRAAVIGLQVGDCWCNVKPNLTALSLCNVYEIL